MSATDGDDLRVADTGVRRAPALVAIGLAAVACLFSGTFAAAVFGVVCVENLGLTDFEETVCTVEVDSVAATALHGLLPAGFVVAAGIAARHRGRPVIFHASWGLVIGIALLVFVWAFGR